MSAVEVSDTMAAALVAEGVGFLKHREPFPFTQAREQTVNRMQVYAEGCGEVVIDLNGMTLRKFRPAEARAIGMWLIRSAAEVEIAEKLAGGT